MVHIQRVESYKMFQELNNHIWFSVFDNILYATKVM